VIDCGSEFQTVGAECPKEPFANSVLLKGLISSGTSDERNVRAGWLIRQTYNCFNFHNLQPKYQTVADTRPNKLLVMVWSKAGKLTQLL